MIEITGARTRKDEKEKISKKGRLSSVKHGSKTFSSELHKTMALDIEGTIDELMEDLKDQEKRFLEKQNDHELLRYKALVQKIIKQIIAEGLQEKTLKRKKKNWGDYVIIEKINTKLLDLTSAITRQNKAFNLLKTIEEIRGLILDLVY
ncbi:MAG TPA: DUF327 family protein [Spirochaetota bacterium]|nr:DUF327 family protein [Spirochaetota bacterium]HPV43033.1 DUF327 family protein [Spirochaetota bacterium]